jgi:hypothetical protein
MASQDPTHSRTDCLASEDRRMARAVLVLLLAEHPVRLTIPELVLAFEPGAGFATRDGIEDAVRELAGAGLLRVAGEVAEPTRAAIYFDRLDI